MPDGGCRDYRRARGATRRQFLAAGGAGALSLTLPRLLQAQVAAGPRPRAKSLILVYCFGGPSHLDMWDLKPEGPSAFRGPFAPIATKLAGTVYSEHLPELAWRNDRFTLVRSMTHERNVHGGAVGFTLTGTRTADAGIPGVRGPDSTPADHPSPGAVVNRFSPAGKAVPSAVTLPWDMIDGQGRFVPGQTAGMLGGAFDPWFVKSDPAKADFRVEGLLPQPGLGLDRFAERRALLAAVDDQCRQLDEIAEANDLDAYYQAAFDLVTSRETRTAFDIALEPESLRDRYGRNAFGQSCLLARRLVEAGVRLVQVNASGSLFGDYGWDTHSDNFNHLQKKLLPRFDPGLAALLDDLEDRGLLDDTLVVAMGEFGRTPAISRIAGRDHWPHCYSVLLAGAGIRRGYQHGRSDRQGAWPAEDPVAPEDLVATLYASLGIDPACLIHDATGREHTLVKGRVLDQLFDRA
jgi:uncharacterized protein (DUF1501 family)